MYKCIYKSVCFILNFEDYFVLARTANKES